MKTLPLCFPENTKSYLNPSQPHRWSLHSPHLSAPSYSGVMNHIVLLLDSQELAERWQRESDIRERLNISNTFFKLLLWLSLLWCLHAWAEWCFCHFRKKKNSDSKVGAFFYVCNYVVQHMKVLSYMQSQNKISCIFLYAAERVLLQPGVRLRNKYREKKKNKWERIRNAPQTNSSKQVWNGAHLAAQVQMIRGLSVCSFAAFKHFFTGWVLSTSTVRCKHASWDYRLCCCYWARDLCWICRR